MSNAIHDRASAKAFAQVTMLQMDIASLQNDVKWKKTGGVSLEEIESVLAGTKVELEVWNYILSLIEKADKL